MNLQYRFFVGTLLIIFCHDSPSAELTSQFMDQVQNIGVDAGEEIHVQVTAPEYNSWLSSHEFLKDFSPVVFDLKLKSDGAGEAKLKSEKRLPLEVEKELSEAILNLEEIFFVKDKIFQILKDPSGHSIYLRNEKIVIDKKGQTIEVEFDEDLRSLGKKFLKKITIEKGSEDSTQVLVDSQFSHGVMLPKEIKISRQARMPIYATKGHFFQRHDQISFLLSDYDVIRSEK